MENDKRVNIQDPLIEEEENAPIKEHEVNMKYLHTYCAALGLANFQAGWVIAGSNQSQYTISTQLGWTTEERIFNYSMINVATMIGVTIGAVAGGELISKGRRRTLFIANFLAIFSSIIVVFLNFWCICIGKFLFGISAGMFQVVAPKIINEVVPVYKLKFFGLLTNVYICLGVTVVMLMGLGLPKHDQPELMKESQLWRYIFGMPAVIAIMLYGCLFTILKHDSISFLLGKGKDDEALIMIERVYKCESEEQKQEILAQLKSEMAVEFREDAPEEPGIGTVMCDRKYRKATWTMFFWTFFFMWTGIDALNMYSNIIIVEMNKPRISEGKEPFFNAEVGSVLVGATQFVGSMLAYFSVTKFNRVTLLFWGHIAMGLLWLSVAISNRYEYNMLANLFISIFIIIFSMTEGPLIWMYGAEVLNDSQLGVAGLGFTLNLLGIAYLTEYIIKWIKPEGLFFIFSGTTLIGAFWIKAFLKETQGLTDFQKRNLYTPKDIIEANKEQKELEMTKVTQEKENDQK